jgi:hypothetical protein
MHWQKRTQSHPLIPTAGQIVMCHGRERYPVEYCNHWKVFPKYYYQFKFGVVELCNARQLSPSKTEPSLGHVRFSVRSLGVSHTSRRVKPQACRRRSKGQRGKVMVQCMPLKAIRLMSF